MTKRELIDKAKLLLKASNASDAAPLFVEAIDKFNEELNDWDVSFILQCERQISLNRDVVILADRFPNSDIVNRIYCWYLYDKHVSSFDKNKIEEHEKGIEKLTSLCTQKNFQSEIKEKFPCPYTLAVLHIIKEYRRPSLNAKKVKYWLDKLDPEKLSKSENIFSDKLGKERRLASPFEDYYSILTDLYLKEEKFQDCIEVCEYALSNIDKFHYDNDIWFKRRLALAMIESGNEEDGFQLLVNLSENKKGEKWFIFNEIASVYFNREDYEKCLQFCKKGISSFGEENFKINLFILTARALFKLSRAEDAKIMAEFVSDLSKVHDLRENNEIQRILDYFKVTPDSLDSKLRLNQSRKKMLEMLELNSWPSSLLKGVVDKIHDNFKSGLIKHNEKKYFFGMRDVKGDKSNLAPGMKIEFTLKDATDKEGKPTKHAVIQKIFTK